MKYKMLPHNFQFLSKILLINIILLTLRINASDVVQRKGGIVETLNVLMKGASPSKFDLEALAEGNTAHHILLFGCKRPASRKIYDVGMEVGGKTGINHIVLQIHYAHKFPAGAPKDYSGIQLTMTHQRPKYQAGIYLLLAYQFSVPANKEKFHADISCKYEGESNMYPFAYRTHAHSLGRVISGYQYNDSMHQIGKGNPQWPQAFYPSTAKVVVKPGDYLAARCTYSSINRNRVTYVGATSKDEMCNFYIMFYTDGNAQEVAGNCFGNQEQWLIEKLPSDSDKPLPPNPELDAMAAGHHHHHEPHGSVDTTIITEKPPKGKVDTNQDYHHEPHGSVDTTIIAEKPPKGKVDANPDFKPSGNDYSESLDQYPNFLNIESRVPNNYHQKRYDGYYGYPSDIYPEPGNRLLNYDDYDPALLKQRLPAEDLSEDVKSRNRNKAFEEMNQAMSSSRKKTGPAYMNIKEGIPIEHRKSFQSGFVPSSSFEENRSDLSHGAVASRNEKKGGKTALVKQSTEETSTVSVTDASRPPIISSKENLTVSFISDWPAESEKLGEVGGVATDKQGNVYVFHRGSRTWTQRSFDYNEVFQEQTSPIPEDTVIVFDKNGKVIKRFGQNMFFMPHGIEIDDKDNMWLTDVALHQVLRYAPGESAPNLIKGQKFKPGKDKDHFCKPSDVAILSTGEFYVSDGYCNGRIMKFDKAGKLLKEWGTVSSSIESSGYPPTGTFSVVHSITVAEKLGILCVADRENGRIQCFDLNGTFIQQMHPVEFSGRLFAIEFSPLYGGVLFAVNGPSMVTKTSPVAGFMIDIHSGKIVNSFNTKKGLKNPHDVAVDVENQCVYIGDLNPSKIWKFHIQGKYHPTTVSKKEEIEVKKEEDDYMPSLIIGALLIIPVVLLLVITATVRLYHTGKLQCLSIGRRSSKQKFNLGNFLNPHKGFDALSTEESDHEVEPWDDSDQEEFSIIHSKNQKA